MAEHAVIIRFEYRRDSLDPLYELEDQLEAAIAKAGVGEYDGHEIAMDMSDGTLWMYGPDAEHLFATVLPVIESCPFTATATVILRFGAAGTDAREESFRLSKNTH